MSRKVISYEIRGLTRLYYDRISKDIKRALIEEAREAGDVASYGITKILNRLISEYYALKYGQEERSKIRNEYMKDDLEELEKINNQLERKYGVQEV